MNQKIIVIGDVHACVNTFNLLLEKIDCNDCKIIQVGDLIDRGIFPVEILERAIELEKELNAVFLMGNHEHELIKYMEQGTNPNWLKQGGDATIKALKNSVKGINYYYNWILKRPLFFETEQVFVSHAGISPFDDAMNLASKNGILWYRGELKKIAKMQIHGHTPIYEGTAVYTPQSNSWNIDTAACYGKNLTAIQIHLEDLGCELITEPTDKKDIEEAYYI